MAVFRFGAVFLFVFINVEFVLKQILKKKSGGFKQERAKRRILNSIYLLWLTRIFTILFTLNTKLSSHFKIHLNTAHIDLITITYSSNQLKTSTSQHKSYNGVNLSFIKCNYWLSSAKVNKRAPLD